MPPKKKPGKLPSSLPAVPQYTPLVSQSEPHEAAGLPQEWCTSEVGVFKQLFTREIWESLCDNTNAYYLRQSMTESGPAAGTTVIPRSWKPTTVGELKVWVGLLLCMGVVRFPAITDYWRDYWKLNPMSAMSLNRFQQNQTISPCLASSAPRRKASMVAENGANVLNRAKAIS